MWQRGSIRGRGAEVCTVVELLANTNARTLSFGDDNRKDQRRMLALQTQSRSTDPKHTTRPRTCRPQTWSRTAWGAIGKSIVVLFALVCSAPGAVAQGLDIPASVVQSAGAIDGAGTASIQNYIGPNLEVMRLGKPEDVKVARNKLIEMVSPTRGPSVSFRLAYTKALLPELEKLLEAKADKPEDRIAVEMGQVNALVITGELAAGEVPKLLAIGRESTLASVRYQAAMAAERALAIVNKEVSPALGVADVNNVLKAQGDVLKNETDLLIVDKALSTLVLGAGNPSYRDEALKQLDEGLLAIAKKYSGKEVPDVLIESIARTANDLRLAFLNVTNVQALPRTTQQAAGGIPATIVWLARTCITGKQVPLAPAGSEVRERWGQAVGASESFGSLLTANKKAIGLSDKIRMGNGSGDASLVTSGNEFIKMMKDKMGVPDRYQ